MIDIPIEQFTYDAPRHALIIDIQKLDECAQQWSGRRYTCNDRLMIIGKKASIEFAYLRTENDFFVYQIERITSERGSNFRVFHNGFPIRVLVDTKFQP